MATYTAIPDSAVDPDSPLTSELVTALRDNPIAIAEGAAGAPSLAEGYANSAAAGGVGSYIFAVLDYTNDSERVAGDTVSGAQLTPVGIRSETANPGATPAEFTTGEIIAEFNGASPPAGTLSGTWRCMGYAFTDDDSVTVYATTLWLRIV